MMHTGNNNLFRWLMLAFICGTCFADSVAPPKWESLKQIDRLWMGFEEGEISPASSEIVRAEFNGQLLILGKDHDLLKKDQHWATQEPRQLALDRETISLEKKKLAQFTTESKFSEADATEQAETALEELDRKRMELEAGMLDEDFPNELRERAKAALVKLNEKIVTAKKKADPKVAKNKRLVESREKEIAIEKKEKEFELTKKRMEWRAKEGGLLVFSATLRELIAKNKGDSVWVRTGDSLATITNDEYFEVGINVLSPLMQSLPREEMQISISHPRTGVPIVGKLSRVVENDGITKLFFRLDKGAFEGEKFQQKSKMLVQIFRVFDKKVRFVMKKDLAFVSPDILSQEGWSGVVKNIWPKARILQIGSQGIAVEEGK